MKSDLNYISIIQVQDWGATLSKVILEITRPITSNSITNDTFKVEIERYDYRKGKRKVTNAYVSDKDGNRAKTDKYITLEMEIGPTVSLGNGCVDYNYLITQVEDIVFGLEVIKNLSFNNKLKEVREGVDKFDFDMGIYDGMELKYAHYTPKKGKTKNPLIIWLHGVGEGGQDPTMPLTGNKAVSFVDDKIQEIFDGAYVLVPQAPTYWMDGVSGIDNDGTSIYTYALIEMIDEYVNTHSDIDKNRIYIGGASNGGYMTEILLSEKTGYFAAAFPTCGAIKEEHASDEYIQNIIKTPTWWTVTKTDTTIDFGRLVQTRYQRLIDAGANNTVLVALDAVIDQSGLYNNHRYSDHCAWIPVFNNDIKTEINGVEISIMEWLASNRLK